jgi:DHA1 family bicyclomycin/chloramphenicol resistance-like MFS transporter
MLIFARLLQGLGASSGAVSCLAMVRDRFDGPEMIQVLALVGAVVGLAPIVAPLIGGILESFFHWRASFIFLMIFASLLWLWVAFKLPETRTQPGQPLRTSLVQYQTLLKNPEFVVHASLATFAFLCIFAFLTIGGPILMGTMGLSSATFSVMFASNASMFLFSNLLTARLSKEKTSQELVILGILIMGFSGLSMLGLTWTQNPLALIIPMHGVTFGAAIVMIMGNAGSVAPFQEIAGSASAMAGTLRFVAAGLLAAGLATIQHATALHLAILILLCTLICVAAGVRLYANKDRDIAVEAPPAT